MSSSTPSFSEMIAPALPLKIRGIEVNAPVLTLHGEQWGLTIWCAWTIAALDVDWESPDIEDRAWDLVGHQIERVSVVEIGPVFHLDEEVAIRLDESGDDDPWVLDLPGGFVAGGTHGPHS